MLRGVPVAMAAVYRLAAVCGLQASVLMLNAHYMALRVISARRALSLLFKQDTQANPVAEIVHVENGHYISYSFDDWAELSRLRREFEPGEHDWVRTVRFDLAVPRIIRVLTYNRVPKQQVKFNRRNIYARDRSRCQYCGQRFATADLSLDHVVPRSQGGGTSWENLVCCCLKCNVKKGGRTPEQAHMKLISTPAKPARSPAISIKLTDARYHSWRQFLDHAYWDVELT
jgi:5-methylcytosine-specific restriction endonuclease McrA